MLKISQTYKLFICFFLIFVLVFSIAYLTPLHSDDYFFSKMGLSWEAHSRMYMHWSGRLISTLISALILSFNHIVVALFCASSVCFFIYNIATIPYFSEQYSYPKNKLWVVSLLLFGAYWISNPALGQTTFWFVGLAYYLWPMIFISICIKYTLRYANQQEKISVKQYLFIGIIAFLAGCSNETSSVLILYLSSLFLIYSFFKKTKYRKLSIIVFFMVLIGTLVLLLAPGNMERASHPAFEAWRNMPIIERLSNHFFVIVPEMLKSYFLIYPLLIWAVTKNWRALNNVDKYLIFSFFSVVFVFIIITIPSPGANTARAQTAGFYYLLIILSFLLKNIDTDNLTKKIDYIVIFLYGALFVISSTKVCIAYNSFDKQGKIQEITIMNQAKNGNKIANYPHFYIFPWLKQGDYPDLAYRNPEGMEKYYGIEEVKSFDVDFDYAKIWNKKCSNNFDLSSFKFNGIKCIYVFRNHVSGANELIFEFSPSIKTHIDNNDRFYIDISKVNSEKKLPPYRIDIPLATKVVEIDGRYFAAIEVSTNSVGFRKSLEINDVAIYHQQNQNQNKPIKVSF